MAIVACTAFFGSDEGRGWSETHHILVTDPVSSLIGPLQGFKEIIDGFRKPLLGRDRYVKGLRVSYRTATGEIASSPFEYQPVAYAGNQREGCAPSVSAKARFGNATNTRFSDVYLRGFWDAVEVDETLNFTTAAGQAWKQLFDQWVGMLVTRGYGWLGTNPATTSRGIIQSYTIQANGRVQFVLTPTNGVALPPVGSNVSFRAARLNKSSSPLNTTMIATVINATAVETVEPIAAGPFLTEGTYTIRQTAFIQYTGLQYVKLARRAEGKATGLTPGRAKAKARY